MGDRPAGVLGRARELEGLGAVEGGRGADLARLERLDNCSVLPLYQLGGGLRFDIRRRPS